MPQSPPYDDSYGEPPRWLPESVPGQPGQRFTTVENPFYQHAQSTQSCSELGHQQPPHRHPQSLENHSHRNFHSNHLSSSKIDHRPPPPHRFSQCKQKSLNTCHRREVAERSPVPLLAQLLKGNNFVPISQRLVTDQADAGQLHRQPLRDRNCYTVPSQQLLETQLDHQNTASLNSCVGEQLFKSSLSRPLGESVSCHLPKTEPDPPVIPPKADAPKKPRLRHTRTFTLTRGESGYGFLLSGECPTAIGSVAKGCAAQVAGLRSGDVILKVNDTYVANSSHDEVVTLIGSALDPLRLTISDPDPETPNKRLKPKRQSVRRSAGEKKRRSGVGLAADAVGRTEVRRRKVGFQVEVNPDLENQISSDEDLALEELPCQSRVTHAETRRRKSSDQLSSQQSKRQSNYRNPNQFSADKESYSRKELNDQRSLSSMRIDRRTNYRATTEIDMIMDKNDNKENEILRANGIEDKRERNRGDNQPSVLPIKTSNQVKLAKKASLSSLSSLIENISPPVSELAPERINSGRQIVHSQPHPQFILDTKLQQSSSSRLPSRSPIPPPIPPHRNLLSQPDPSDSEFQPPPPPPPPSRSQPPRPRPSSIQLDPCHENIPLEQLGPLYFSDATAPTQRNSYAGETLFPRPPPRRQHPYLVPSSKTSEIKPSYPPHSMDLLGAQSSADDIRRSMNKLYPLLLQPENSSTVAVSGLVRSQSVRQASKANDGELKLHLYEEVASDEEDGAMSSRSPGKKVSELRHSPLMRSVSHSQEGSVSSFNDIAQDDSGLRGFPPDSFTQLCRREASETSILDSAMNGDDDDDDPSLEIGRAASWATKFERLLADPIGVAMFRDFLQKEFSDENMRFYLTVESFKTRPPPLDEEARRIYDTFLAPDALDSVNVDAGGVARVSEAMNRVIEANLFNDAQAQIFKLMKFDCYARFLKSEAYKGAVLAEMEGRPIQACVIGDVNDLAKANVNNNLPSNPLEAAKAGGIGRQSDFAGMRPPKMMSKDGKVRHSLMPWNKGKARDSKIPKLRKSFGGKKDAVNVVKKDMGGVERKKPFFASRANVASSAAEKRKVASSTSTFQNHRTLSLADSEYAEVSVKTSQIEKFPEAPVGTEFKVPSLKRFISYSQLIRRSLGSSRESLGSLGASRESLNGISGEIRGRDASAERNAPDAIDAQGNRKDRKAIFRIDLPNQSKSLEIKARFTKPMGDIIDPLFAKYKFSNSISDVFLFNAATNSIYGRADYEVLNAGVFHNQRILISIRGHHRQLSNSFANSRRDALVHDNDVATAAGGVGAETLSRVTATDRYDDQRGPLTSTDLEIPDWLNAPSADPSPKSDDASVFDKISSRNEWRGVERGGSRYGSASSLSVNSGVGLSEREDAVKDITGSIPSPDIASVLFADAMGHAPEASLGDSKTRIDLGLGECESPEVARDGANSSFDGAGSRFWRDNDDAFLDDTLGDGDHTMTSDFTLPDDIRGSSSDLGRGLISDGSISLHTSLNVADTTLPSLRIEEAAMNRRMRNLNVTDEIENFGNDTLVEQSIVESTFVDASILDATIVDQGAFDCTKIEEFSERDREDEDEFFVDALDSFVSGVDETFHDVDKSALTTTFTDVSQLSALSSLPSAPSSSPSDESCSDVEKLETLM